MTVIWIALAIGLLLVLAKKIVWRLKRGSASDMGSVSDQWISEHRLAQTQDARQ
jgi:hypothetical protein